MTVTTYDLHVVMEGGQEWNVTADQRDVAAFEIEPVIGCSVFEAVRRPYTYARYLAWRAGKRAKLHAMTWDEFQEQCIDADSVEAPDADPTNPEASAGPSSS